jgi:hypothetical protein
MTALAPTLIRQSSEISDFGLVMLLSLSALVVSLSGLVLSLVLVGHGVDLSAGIYDGLTAARLIRGAPLVIAPQPAPASAASCQHSG